ncbi:HD-GYP domain-containing protein [Piscinibacter terrae]|uniref:HD domain-containing protein n=1 Tax=Piscinibacter terrae TaxID=2496871 RepID=A0A3N7ISW1_9BURK|nr:HD domain-containing protein [Albitalea terrae]RQP21932.1 HD domain-containing protein [Albitalea terrae]
MGAAVQVFQLANPHALASILDASTTRRIVASRDILDDRGSRLWARDQPVSHSLHQRLQERRLRQPLETCLRAEDGVTPFVLQESLAEFLSSTHPLALALQPMAPRLAEEVEHLPLHPAVQLLLTAAHATRPAVYEHAVRGMALAGALQMQTRTERYAVRLAMLGGLLHDIGEMYVNPAYLQGRQPLDMLSYRHVVTHPRVGELLLATMTDYPSDLARAIGEHHERLDGSGYPMRRRQEQISPLGMVLSATETALGVGDADEAPLSRVSFALRMVAGEYDESCVDFFAKAAERAGEDARAAVTETQAELIVQLALMDTELSMLREEAQALVAEADSTRMVRDVAGKVAERVQRLRAGWNSMGLWCMAQPQDSPRKVFELSMARDELRYRLSTLERDCLWPHGELLETDALQLDSLWRTELA